MLAQHPHDRWRVAVRASLTPFAFPVTSANASTPNPDVFWRWIQVLSINRHQRLADIWPVSPISFPVTGTCLGTIHYGQAMSEYRASIPNVGPTLNRRWCVPRKHKTKIQCWFNVRPGSATLAQHCVSLRSTSHVRLVPSDRGIWGPKSDRTVITRITFVCACAHTCAPHMRK